MKRPTLLILAVAVIAGGLYFYSSSDKEPKEVAGNASSTEAMDSEKSGETMASPEVAAESHGTYTLDVESSTLNWAAERIVGNSHKGTVAIASGSMTLSEGEVTEGDFVVDMTRISESNDTQMFLNHIASDDFFSVAEHPTATMEILSAVPVSGDGNIVNYDVTAALTIRGITNEVTFPATAELFEDGMHVTADFRIDRTRWEIIYDSGSIFLQLGDKAIRDEITFNLDLVFVADGEAMEGEAAAEGDAS